MLLLAGQSSCSALVVILVLFPIIYRHTDKRRCWRRAAPRGLPVAAVTTGRWAASTVASYLVRLASLHGLDPGELWDQVSSPQPGTRQRAIDPGRLAVITGRPDPRLVTEDGWHHRHHWASQTTLPLGPDDRLKLATSCARTGPANSERHGLSAEIAT